MDPNQWIADLTTADKQILESEEWLNDAIIYASMEILGKQCEGKIHGKVHSWQKVFHFDPSLLHLSLYRYFMLVIIIG